MYLIIGLGNPAKQYEKTRHNVGFDVIEAMAGKYGIDVKKRRRRALCGIGFVEGQRVVLAKPQTYMNMSGESVVRLLRFFHVDPAVSLIVVYDDIHLAPGNIRIREKGSAGGHNGMRDIIAKVGTDAFSRVRIGVGENPGDGDLIGHVLSRFSGEERERVEDAIADAVAALALMVRKKTDEAMNLYNMKKYT